MKASDNKSSLVGRCSDVGKVRSANEDNMGDLAVEGGHVLIVADGMGGYRGGALASHLVVEAIQEYFRDAKIDSPPKAMRQAICLANERIYLRGQQEEELSRMGSTCVLALVIQGRLYLGHVGDSRIYLLRQGGKLQQLTRDHTVVQHFVDVGLLSPEEAEGHPDGHILSRALGPRAHVEPEIGEKPLRLRACDRILLCSDGLTKMFRDNGIEEILGEEGHPQQIAEKLVRIANERGGEDNTTVILFEYHPAPNEKEEEDDLPEQLDDIVSTAISSPRNETKSRNRMGEEKASHASELPPPSDDPDAHELDAPPRSTPLTPLPSAPDNFSNEPHELDAISSEKTKKQAASTNPTPPKKTVEAQSPVVTQPDDAAKEAEKQNATKESEKKEDSVQEKGSSDGEGGSSSS